jgi:hypothetical protein
MLEAIALSSPSGRMSKRARAAAERRLHKALFGDEGLQRPQCRQPSEYERLMRQANTLRELAARGMRQRAFTKEAERLEALAHSLDDAA